MGAAGNQQQRVQVRTLQTVLAAGCWLPAELVVHRHGCPRETHKLVCRSSRWAKPGPLPGTQIGTLELQSRGWENSTAWMWAAVPFMVGAILVLDLSIILCLAYLKSARCC